MSVKARRNEGSSLLLTCPETRQGRREALKRLGALGAVAISGPWSAAMAEPKAMPTPDQILGPFYPVRKPADGGSDMTRPPGSDAGAQGDIIYVMGRVLNMKGEPVRAAQLEIWQANALGRYVHPSDRNPAPL